jgi:cell shape-determining protein MreC
VCTEFFLSVTHFCRKKEKKRKEREREREERERKKESINELNEERPYSIWE